MGDISTIICSIYCDEVGRLSAVDLRHVDSSRRLEAYSQSICSSKGANSA